MNASVASAAVLLMCAPTWCAQPPQASSASNVLTAAATESAAEPVTAMLTPAQPQWSQLTAKPGIRYTAALAPGDAAEFLLTQVEGAVDLKFEDGAGAQLSIRTEAGRRGRVQATLVAGTGSHWQITVTPRRSRATFDVALSPVHMATAADRARLAAFRDYAAAELLRRANYRETVIKDRAADIDARTRNSYAAAIRQFGLLGDGCGQRRAQIGLARMEVAVGNYPKARSLIEQSLGAQCVGDVAEQAQALKTRGMAAAYQGDFADSAAAAESALDLYKKTGDVLYQGVVLGNLSSVYMELGATDRALAAANGALGAAVATDDSQGVVYSRKSIAAIQLARGELAAALASYRQTLVELTSTPYPMIEGETWNDLGILYHRMADYDESLRAYARAQTVWAQMKNHVGIADTTLNQGEALLEQGNHTAAAKAFQQALTLAEADGLKSAQARALRGLGAARMLHKDWAAARPFIAASQALALQIGSPTAQSYALRTLGDLGVRSGDAALARHSYEQALTLAREAGDRDGEAETLARLARAVADSGDAQQGLQLIKQALAIVESQRGQINDPSLRTSYFASFRTFHDTHVDILMQLDRREPNQGYDFAALAAAEQARARSLQDILAERSISIERGVDPQLAAAQRAAEERLSTAAFQLARMPLNDSASRRATLQSSVDAASHSLDEVRGDIRRATPRYAELTHSQPLTLDELQRQLLDANSAALEYWFGDRQSYLWLVTQHSFTAIRLPARAQIEPRIAALQAELTTHAQTARQGGIEALVAQEQRHSRVVRRAALALGRVLLGEALRGVKQRDLAVIGDGSLQQIPFGVLRVAPDGRELRVGRDLVTLPSLTTLRWLRRAASSASRPQRLALIADPVFGGATPASLQRGASDALPFNIRHLAALPHSRVEARTIATMLPKSQVWMALGYAANRDTILTKDWRPFSLVHFAAHSIVDLRRPELSGIVLSLVDRTGQPQDGFLRINDIYNLDMPADLVVLSACESAIGQSLSGEGSFSLARAFFYAGAPRVLASLWAVDDRAAARFMVLFYRALLLEHQSATRALRAAQQAMSHDPRWQAPYYWAGFVLQGDWR